MGGEVSAAAGLAAVVDGLWWEIAKWTGAVFIGVLALASLLFAVAVVLEKREPRVPPGLGDDVIAMHARWREEDAFSEALLRMLAEEDKRRD